MDNEKEVQVLDTIYGVFETDGLIQGVNWNEISTVRVEGFLWEEVAGIE